MKEHLLLVLENGKQCMCHDAFWCCAKRHFDVLGDFAFSFIKNYTVKCLDSEYSDRQGHSVYIFIERMS